ncbi:MAG: EamA family transporter [Candidatus Altiarchaeota archaeon]
MVSWVIFVLLAAFFNAFWVALSKRELKHIDPLALSFVFRGFIIILYLPLVVFFGDFSADKWYWVAVLVGGVTGALGLYYLMVGIKEDFFSTYSMRNAQTVFVLVLAFLFLGEQATTSLIFAILLIFSGSLIFYRAKKLSFHGLASGFFYSFAAVSAKAGVEHGSRVLYPPITLVVTISFLGLLLVRDGHLRKEWGLIKKEAHRIFPISFLSFLSLLAYYEALALADVNVVVPLHKVNIVIGFLLSYFLLGEKDSWKSKLLGGLCILFGAIIIYLI